MPQLKDPNFFQTVTLICQHDENGALGVVINRPMKVWHCMTFSANSISRQRWSTSVLEPVYAGGPVHNELGLVLPEGLERGSRLFGRRAYGTDLFPGCPQSMADGTGPKNAY